MSQYDLSKIQHKLKKHLDKERYEHTLGVRYTCAALAMRYQYDMEKAETAGLLHDCAKCISDDKKISICEKDQIEITPAERENPFLLHAKAGACVARKKYEIEDDEILSAITYHTTGREAMTLLEKIVYIADFIEPNRDTAPNLKEIRAIAFRDLDEAMYVILENTLSYLEKKGKSIDPMTQVAYEYYKQVTQQKGESV